MTQQERPSSLLDQIRKRMEAQPPEAEDAKSERRRTNPIARYSAGGVTVSVALLVALVGDMQTTKTALADLAHLRTMDMATISSMSAEVRGLTSRIQEAIASYDRRIGDCERADQYMRTEIHSITPATQTLVREAEVRLRAELLARIEAEHRRYIPQSATGRSRVHAIAAALASIPADQPALWTRDGRPTVLAVQLALGGPVTAAEVSAAWALMHAGPDPTQEGPRTATITPEP